MAKSSSSRIATVKATPGPPGFDKAQGELNSVEFRPAKGGVISEVRRRMKGKGGMDLYNHETDTTIHPSFEHVVNHLRSVLGNYFTGDSGED